MADEVHVLIVGGSLVGLTTAMLLGYHGVPSLLRERAIELGATVRNRTEATAIEQDDEGVTVARAFATAVAR